MLGARTRQPTLSLELSIQIFSVQSNTLFQARPTGLSQILQPSLGRASENDLTSVKLCIGNISAKRSSRVQVLEDSLHDPPGVGRGVGENALLTDIRVRERCDVQAGIILDIHEEI